MGVFGNVWGWVTRNIGLEGAWGMRTWGLWYCKGGVTGNVWMGDRECVKDGSGNGWGTRTGYGDDGRACQHVRFCKGEGWEYKGNSQV